jgi:zinc D-Ala-D-Ala carboxypeptidase
MSKAQWGLYPNFSKAEFDCKQTGENEMTHEFMVKLQRLRHEFDRPLTITSGFRSKRHSIEARKTHSNGEHTQGNCCDVACVNSATRFRLIELALKHGITRIGIAKNFLHLGIGGIGLPNNVIWDYQ